MSKVDRMGSKKTEEMRFWTKDKYKAFSREIMDKVTSEYNPSLAISKTTFQKWCNKLGASSCCTILVPNFAKRSPSREREGLLPAGLCFANPVSPLPLDGFGSAVPSFQLHPVFGAVSNRVPPGNAMSCFVGFGDKSWDSFKNFFQTQGIEFLFCPKGHGGPPLKVR